MVSSNHELEWWGILLIILVVVVDNTAHNSADPAHHTGHHRNRLATLRTVSSFSFLFHLHSLFITSIAYPVSVLLSSRVTLFSITFHRSLLFITLSLIK